MAVRHTGTAFTDVPWKIIGLHYHLWCLEYEHIYTFVLQFKGWNFSLWMYFSILEGLGRQ